MRSVGDLPPGLPRLWVIWLGVLLTAVLVVVMSAWWWLPRWAPELVIRYAPWPEPALRAWRIDGEDEGLDTHQLLEARLLDWGPDIGPALRREFELSDEHQRMAVIALASEVARADGIAAFTTLPEERRRVFSDADIAQLREDLVRLVLAAMADGSSYLPSNASYVAMSLRDRRTLPPARAFLAKQKPPVFEDLEPVIRFLGAMRDPAAVPVLINLLPIRHKPHPTVEEALEQCLAAESVPDVIAAARHDHEVVRTWAVHQLERFLTSTELVQRIVALMGDRERQVALAAIVAVAEHTPSLAGPTLLDVARTTKDERVQSYAIRALGEVGFVAAQPYLRDVAQRHEDEVGQRAITALGLFRDAADIDLLLSFIGHPTKAEVAITALRQMPLSDAQRQHVEAASAQRQKP